MTDILDLEGWNVIAKHVDGDDYLIEAEYTVPPKACTKCGTIGNLYKHGTKPIYIRDSPIRGRPVRILANARRIVACVNACAGISIESLEAGGIGSILSLGLEEQKRGDMAERERERRTAECSEKS